MLVFFFQNPNCEMFISCFSFNELPFCLTDFLGEVAHKLCHGSAENAWLNITQQTKPRAAVGKFTGTQGAQFEGD